MTQPLREDFPIYDLPSEKVIDGPWPAAQTPAAVLSNPDELAKPKKPRKKKSATGRKRGRPVKNAKAPVETPVNDALLAASTPVTRNIAPSGEGVWDRLKRVKGDTWLIVAACFAAIALGTSIAFMVIR